MESMEARKYAIDAPDSRLEQRAIGFAIETRGEPLSERLRASRDATRWFALAVGSLAVAGAFSLVLVMGRIPLPNAAFMPDAALAQRSLVVHVNLAMGVWFFACMAGLFCLLPGRGRLCAAPAAVAIALFGVIMLVIPTFFRTAVPVLSNYVPALDHPLFLTGLVVFAAGVLLSFADRRLLTSGHYSDHIPVDAQHGLRAAAIVFVIALLTFAGAYATQPAGMTTSAYYERLFWGGGHVLQTANTLGMLSAWLILLQRLTGRGTLSSRPAAALFGIMLLPTLLGPWLTLGTHQGDWFTRMMQYGIFPVVIVVIVCGAKALWTQRHRLEHDRLRAPALAGLLTSAAMTLAGFVLGAMIVADTTLTPAHYHANIGAVTVAYMAVLMVLLPRLRATMPWPRLARWQPLIYGAGQMLFVLGLAIAGTLGQAPRKTYGQAPHVLASSERIGLMIVGAGGVLAFGGGVLFISIMARAVWDASRGRGSQESTA